MSKTDAFLVEKTRKETIHRIKTGCSQLIHRLAHDGNLVSACHLWHAFGCTARISGKYNRLFELAADDATAENGAKLFMFLQGAADITWPGALTNLVAELTSALRKAENKKNAAYQAAG